MSPRVVDDGWGFVEIEGLGRFRDAKLWPGVAYRSWARRPTPRVSIRSMGSIATASLISA